MSDKLKDLYQEVILKHNNAPKNFEKRADATYCLEAYNPVCGDHFTLYFDIEEGRISNPTFHGYGCAISKSSASILTELIKGKSVEKALGINVLFKSALLQGKSQDKLPEELIAFTPVVQHPGRIKCVTLCWDSLEEFLRSPK